MKSAAKVKKPRAAPPVDTAADATTGPRPEMARTRNAAVPKPMEGIKVEALKSFGADFDAVSAFKTAAEKATHSLEAVTEATMAALTGAEKARAYLAANSKTALESQFAAASAFAKVKTPQEAFDLQAQFARNALDAYSTNVSEISELFSSSLSATLKPLSATFA